MSFFRTLWCCFASWKIGPATQSQLKDADVVIAPSFGARDNGCGESNAALTEVIKNLQSEYPFPPPLPQGDIAICFPDGYLMSGVAREHRTRGEYLDTREVIAQFAEVCKAKGWTTVVVVAHPAHMWRAMRVARRLGLVPLAADTSAVPYDVHSSQWWTRSATRLVLRELLARLAYLARGWI